MFDVYYVDVDYVDVDYADVDYVDVDQCRCRLCRCRSVLALFNGLYLLFAEQNKTIFIWLLLLNHFR